MIGSCLGGMRMMQEISSKSTCFLSNHGKTHPLGTRLMNIETSIQRIPNVTHHRVSCLLYHAVNPARASVPDPWDMDSTPGQSTHDFEVEEYEQEEQ